jgi:hypothetical protein
MPRKRKQGERTPSTRLNDTVNQLSDGEFEDVVAILRGGKKKRKYLELIVWHRGRQPYDADEEKDAFNGYDLNSLRVVACRQLDQVVLELRSGLPTELSLNADAMTTSSREKLQELLAEIGVAKAHAIKRCYLERLVKLIGMEAELLPLICEGTRLEIEMQRVSKELNQAHANVTFAKELVHHRAAYPLAVIAEINKTGHINQELINAYKATPFAAIDVSGYPLPLMSGKLFIDEIFASLEGDATGASEIAESVYELDLRSKFLSPLEHAKLLTRMYDYYSALGDKVKGQSIIGYFEAIGPEAAPNRKIYLIRYLVVLLDWAVDRDDDTATAKAIQVFERNRAAVLDEVIGGYRSRILIAMMLFYLGEHDVSKAKSLFDNLYRNKEQKPPILYRVTFLICHLMILFDLKDVLTMKQQAKNHREFLLEKGQIAEPAIEFLAFLRKNAKIFAAPRITSKKVVQFNTEIDAAIEELQMFNHRDKIVKRLFYAPIIKWLNGKRL